MKIKRHIFFSFSILTHLNALPISPEVMIGSAEFKETNSSQLNITASKNASINWESFSVAEHESVQFVQPDADSCLLNRVTGSASSEILGNIQANGKILLINPNGVLIGRDARIDLNSLMVSTYDVADEQIANFKSLSFSGASEKSIRHEGRINALESALFVSQKIENEGSVHACKEICFQSRDHGNFDPFSSIQCTGTLTAPHVEFKSGMISLNEMSTINASNRDLGGAISLLGNQIFVSSTSQLIASAIENGHGGKVIIQAEDATYFAGKIYASGGEFGGNGGFAEVSGKAGIDYRGLAFLDAKNGKQGTLLLDPTDIVIGVGGGAPSGCNPCLSSTCGAMPGTCSTFTTGNLDSAALQNQLSLGACDVIIDATGAGGGAGTITHNAGAPISWSTSNSLTYNAVSNITILSQVQNTGAVGAAGNIFLRTQGGTIQINTAANTNSVSVGSQNGLTQVCAPNADVVLQASSTFDRHAQIGFLAPEGVLTTCAGPISVTCRNLTLLCSGQSNVGAQIGHGQAGAGGGALGLITQSTATIDVAVSGNLLLQNAPVPSGNQTACRIGHGAQILNMGSFLRGDITVNVGGRIDMLANSAAVSVTVANIGHAETNSGGAPYSVAGNIFVQAGSDINIQYINPYPGTFTTLGIGSNGNIITSVTGNITVVSGRDLIMTGPINAFPSNRMIIGWFGPTGPCSINSLIRVSACRDIILTPNDVQSDFFFIGSGTGANNFLGNSNVEVSAGRDLIFTTAIPGNTPIGNGRARIGSPANTGTSLTFVNAGRDISISGSRRLGIQGVGNISVSAGGNISLTTTGTSVSEFAYIGPNNGNSAVTTRVYAGGSITATNSSFARAIIGRGAVATAAYASSLDVRAGGNIQIASPFTLNAGNLVVPTTGSIFIEADTLLPAGSLWTSGGGQITSISTIPMVLPILTSGACGIGTTANSSPAISPNFQGGLSFNTGGLGGFVTLQTTNQPITLHSSPTLVNGANTPDLIVGTGDNQVQLLTTSGSIDMSGSICQTGFRNININTVAAPWTTGGNVLARAANEIQVNTAVATGGAGNTITLVADLDFTGGGNLLINNDIQTNNGNIFLSAAANPDCTNNYLCSGGIFPGIDSSVIQNSGTISSGSGSITIQASNNIIINGDPISITATSGTIQTRAGNNTFVFREISNTAPTGIIQMISGNNMTMQGGTISSPNQVVLVVDDLFPSAPLIGTGAFMMDALSVISGSEIRIYTARQQLNTILGLLNITPFAAGTLFQNTSQEQWATYFSCANPFLNIGFPFTIFYKDSLQEATQQAMIIVDEFLVDLHPYNEFPGWMVRFLLIDKTSNSADEIPYMIRRRNLNLMNHPKTWTKLNMTFYR